MYVIICLFILCFIYKFLILFLSLFVLKKDLYLIILQFKINLSKSKYFFTTLVKKSDIIKQNFLDDINLLQI